MSDLRGTIHAVTGANSGVGKATAHQLASRGATVILICRSRERGERAREEIRDSAGAAHVELRVADLASLDQVRRLGRELAAELDRLEGLVNNAGVYRADLELTEDGLERTMAVNHLSHFLLTHLLFPRLRAASGRVVNVSSDSHRVGNLRRAPLESILRGRVEYRGMRAYADSKLANVLFTFELDRHIAGSGVTTNAVHPGMLATRIWNQNRDFASLLMRLFKPFMRSPRRGGAAVARLAMDPDLAGVSGRYFDGMKERRAAPVAYDTKLARELWDLSARLTGAEALQKS